MDLDELKAWLRSQSLDAETMAKLAGALMAEAGISPKTVEAFKSEIPDDVSAMAGLLEE